MNQVVINKQIVLNNKVIKLPDYLKFTYDIDEQIISVARDGNTRNEFSKWILKQYKFCGIKGTPNAFSKTAKYKDVGPNAPIINSKPKSPQKKPYSLNFNITFDDDTSNMDEIDEALYGLEDTENDEFAIFDNTLEEQMNTVICKCLSEGIPYEKMLELFERQVNLFRNN